MVRFILSCFAIVLFTTVSAAQPAARDAVPGWLVTGSPIGIGYVQPVGGSFGVGLNVTALYCGWPLARDSGSDADFAASAALTLAMATGPVVWQAGPAAVVATGGDWGQVYPGYRVLVRTHVPLGPLQVALGVDMLGVRIAGGNGTGDWEARLAPLVGLKF